MRKRFGGLHVNWAFPLRSCVIMVKSLNLSETQSVLCKKGASLSFSVVLMICQDDRQSTQRTAWLTGHVAWVAGTSKGETGLCSQENVWHMNG